VYTGVIMAATGIRELRANLSQYLDRVRNGEEIVVTDRGTAIARIVPLDEPRAFDRLVRDGVIEPAPMPHRSRPRRRVTTDGTVSDLVAEQRR
jgi:prevent-host-death family protein